MRRREVLSLAAGAMAIPVAGCLDELGLSGGSSSAWSGYRGGPTNDGTVPAAAGPGDAPEMAWELTNEDLIEAGLGIDPEELDQLFSGARLSSPVLAGGNVVWAHIVEYLDGQVDQLNALVGADPATGSIEWTVELFPEDSYLGQGDIVGEPVVRDDTVYVPSQVDDELEVVGFDGEDGSVVHETGIRYSATVGQPVIAGETLVTQRDGEAADGAMSIEAHALDTGELRWDTGVDRITDFPASMAVRDGTAVYFDHREQDMVAVDVAEGDEAWRTPLSLPWDLMSGGDRGMIGTPTITDDTILSAAPLEVFFQETAGAMVALDRDGTERWQFEPEPIPLDTDRTSFVGGMPLAVDDLAIGTGIGAVDDVEGPFAVGVDRQSGEVEWTVEIATPHFAPVAAGSTVYLPTQAGIEMLNSDGEHTGTIELTSTSDLVDAHSTDVLNSPALYDGRLFVTTRSGMVAIE